MKNNIYNQKIDTTEEIQVNIDELFADGTSAKLILWNDDVNSFDYIINALVNILKQSHQQAEQCAMIAHNKGKVIVKSGEKDELIKYRDAFSNREISTTIENDE